MFLKFKHNFLYSPYRSCLHVQQRYQSATYKLQVKIAGNTRYGLSAYVSIRTAPPGFTVTAVVGMNRRDEHGYAKPTIFYAGEGQANRE